jgi:hypothetical protein
MQKQQAQQCNAEAAGAKLQCRSSKRYTVLQNQQALYCNEEVAGATL